MQQTTDGSPYLKTTLFLCLTIILAWLWVWGRCASPLAVECFINHDVFPNDVAQSFVGWIAYLRSDSFIPPVFSSITWPHFSSAAYSDSIPIAAIISKVLSKAFHINTPFQYFTELNLINNLALIFLLRWFASKLRMRSYIYAALTLTIVFAPWVLVRLPVHPFHANHFPIIASVILYSIGRRSFFCWSLLSFLAIGMSIYYSPIVLGLYLGTLITTSKINELCVRSLFNQTSIILKKTIIALAPIFTSLIGFYVFGFNLPADKTDPNFQIWDSNIFTFITPQGFFDEPRSISAIVPRFPIDIPYEWEGNAYLGLTTIVLLAILLMHDLLHTSTVPLDRSDTSHILMWRNNKYFWVLPIVFFLLSIGPEWHAGQYHIVSLRKFFPFLYDNSFSLYSYFRASGRFVWPLAYIVYIYCWTSIDYIDIPSQKLRTITCGLIALSVTETTFPLLSTVHTINSERYYQGLQEMKYIHNLSATVFSKAENGDLVLSTGPKAYDRSIPPYVLSLLPTKINTNYRAHVGRYPPSFLDDEKLDNSSYTLKHCNALSRYKGKVYFLKKDIHQQPFLDSANVKSCKNSNDP